MSALVRLTSSCNSLSLAGGGSIFAAQDVARYFLELGNEALKNNNSSDAAKFCHQAEDCLQKHAVGCWDVRAEIKLLNSQILFQTGDLSQACEAAACGLDLVQGSRTSAGRLVEAKLTYQFGELLANFSKYDEANALLVRSVWLLHRLTKPVDKNVLGQLRGEALSEARDWLAKSYDQLGKVKCVLNENYRARYYYSKAAALFSALQGGSSAEAQKADEAHGDIYYQDSILDKALEFYRRAIARAETRSPRGFSAAPEEERGKITNLLLKIVECQYAINPESTLRAEISDIKELYPSLTEPDDELISRHERLHARMCLCRSELERMLMHYFGSLEHAISSNVFGADQIADLATEALICSATAPAPREFAKAVYIAIKDADALAPDEVAYIFHCIAEDLARSKQDKLACKFHKGAILAAKQVDPYPYASVANSYLSLAELKLVSGRLSRAQEYVEQALELHPTNEDYWKFQLSALDIAQQIQYMENGDPEARAATLKKIWRIGKRYLNDSEYTQAINLSRIVRHYIRHNKFHEADFAAAELTTMNCNLEPKIPNERCILARNYLVLAELAEKWAAAVRKELGLNSSSREVRQRHGQLLDQAERCFRRASFYSDLAADQDAISFVRIQTGAGRFFARRYSDSHKPHHLERALHSLLRAEAHYAQLEETPDRLQLIRLRSISRLYKKAGDSDRAADFKRKFMTARKNYMRLYQIEDEGDGDDGDGGVAVDRP